MKYYNIRVFYKVYLNLLAMILDNPDLAGSGSCIPLRRCALCCCCASNKALCKERCLSLSWGLGNKGSFFSGGAGGMGLGGMGWGGILWGGRGGLWLVIMLGAGINGWGTPGWGGLGGGKPNRSGVKGICGGFEGPGGLFGGGFLYACWTTWPEKSFPFGWILLWNSFLASSILFSTKDLSDAVGTGVSWNQHIKFSSCKSSYWTRYWKLIT